MAKQEPEKYLMENAVSPGHTTWVDKDKFDDMKAAVLKVLPAEAPGMTPAELREAIAPHISQAFWPNGEKAGWWMKGVQLDLEAKGMIARGSTKPVKLYRLI